jgi:hypothetical protein
VILRPSFGSHFRSRAAFQGSGEPLQYGGSIDLAQCAGALLAQGLTTPGEVLPLLQGVGH